MWYSIFCKICVFSDQTPLSLATHWLFMSLFEVRAGANGILNMGIMGNRPMGPADRSTVNVIQIDYHVKEELRISMLKLWLCTILFKKDCPVLPRLTNEVWLLVTKVAEFVTNTKLKWQKSQTKCNHREHYHSIAESLIRIIRECKISTEDPSQPRCNARVKFTIKLPTQIRIKQIKNLKQSLDCADKQMIRQRHLVQIRNNRNPQRKRWSSKLHSG